MQDILIVDNIPNSSLPENIRYWISLLTSDIRSQRLSLAKDCKLLTEILNLANQLNVLKIKLPKDLGGSGLPIQLQHYYFREMARSSGALAFLATQHSSAIAIIRQSLNNALCKEYLQNKYLIGISFSYLREIKKPPVTATYVNNSYIVNGVMRYVTGYKIFNMLLFVFVCDDQEVFAITPFQETKTFKILHELDLITSNSTKTVTCQFINHSIKDSMVVSINSFGTFIDNSTKNNSSAHIAAFHIGIALAVMDLIATNKYLEIDIVKQTYNNLIKEIMRCEDQLLEDAQNGLIIKIRIKIINLLYKIFMFGDQIFKGSSTIADNPYWLLKQESQILLSSGSSTDTLIETCKIICE